jgi:hypothetical protein
MLGEYEPRRSWFEKTKLYVGRQHAKKAIRGYNEQSSPKQSTGSRARGDNVYIPFRGHSYEYLRRLEISYVIRTYEDPGQRGASIRTSTQSPKRGFRMTAVARLVSERVRLGKPGMMCLWLQQMDMACYSSR